MTTQNELTPEQRQAFLTEYQVCQQSADGQSSSNWTFAGIFLGLSTAGFAFFIPNIFGEVKLPFQIFTTFISIGMLVIIYAVSRMDKRTREINKLFYDRMREIERKTGMEIETLYENKISSSKGKCYWNIIITILKIFWLLVIIFTWARSA